MPERLFRRLAQRLRAADPAASDLPTDGDLLDRYRSARDEAAFELLVRRHGALVLGVCRRTLRDDHAAEDAFQATFLVLARKAGSVRQATVAGWLYRVALRIALRARQGAARRSVREQPLVSEPAAAEADPLASDDLRAVLDDELGRLPERFRLPVLLCYVEGHTTEQAARLLGCPRGTVLSRLATARQRLGGRLRRRGLGSPVAALTAGLAEPTLSAALAAAAVRGAFSPTQAPTQVAQLAQGVIHAMFLSKVRFALVAVLVLGALAVAGGRVVFDTPAQGQDRPPEAKAPPPQDRPRVAPEQKPAKPPPDPQVQAREQLYRPQKELEERMKMLEVIERDQSRATLDLRMKLLMLEEELRSLERTRDAELADHRRRLELADKTPHSFFGDLVREIQARESILQKLEASPNPDVAEIKRQRGQLRDRRDKLAKDMEEVRRGGLMIEERFAKKSLVLRQEILTLEEQLRLIDRRAGRELSHAESAVDAAAVRIRQMEGLPAPGRGNPELEQRIEELLREMAALRKELKRHREGK
jgi:RNA polymerase sigma factor (sigma-70 family)